MNDNKKIPEKFSPFIVSIPPPFLEFLQDLNEAEWTCMLKPDGVGEIIEALRSNHAVADIVHSDSIKKKWIGVAIFYRYFQNQYGNAFAVAYALYDLMLEHQLNTNEWIHKGFPLAYIRDFFMLMKSPVLAKRFAMLTLCEDSIGDNTAVGHLKKNEGIIFSRLTYYHGMSESQIDDYFSEITTIYFPDRFVGNGTARRSCNL